MKKSAMSFALTIRYGLDCVGVEILFLFGHVCFLFLTVDWTAYQNEVHDGWCLGEGVSY